MDQSGSGTTQGTATTPSNSPATGWPELGSRTVVERPPPGLARGAVPAPAWVVIALGVALVTVGATALVWRATARRRPRARPRSRAPGVT
ncbi:MAG TPA: hypothetical protein PLU22_13660 [Polyangiaceae bacterium]|nr:hypothetical protein [Polyangiaceae bacterium]